MNGHAHALAAKSLLGQPAHSIQDSIDALTHALLAQRSIDAEMEAREIEAAMGFAGQ